MPYKIFLSHSTKDKVLIKWFYRRYTKAGYKVIIASKERPLRYPGYLPEKIKKLIRSCDCVVVLLTKNGIASSWVNQEVGYTLEKKPLIAIVDASSVSHNKLAFLQGTEYISLHRHNNRWAIEGRNLDGWLNSLKSKKQASEKAISAIMAIGLLGIIIWLSSK